MELLKSLYEVPHNISFITPTVKIASFLCNDVKKKKKYLFLTYATPITLPYLEISVWGISLPQTNLNFGFCEPK